MILSRRVSSCLTAARVRPRSLRSHASEPSWSRARSSLKKPSGSIRAALIYSFNTPSPCSLTSSAIRSVRSAPSVQNHQSGSGADTVVNSVRAVGRGEPVIATQIISRALNSGGDATGWQMCHYLSDRIIGRCHNCLGGRGGLICRGCGTGWIRPKSYTRCRDQSVALEFKFPINPLHDEPKFS